MSALSSAAPLRNAIVLAMCTVVGSAAAQESARTPSTGVPENLEELLSGFRTMPGLTAQFTEEKRLALLTLPVRTRGMVAFAPPGRLVRRVTSPAESVALIENGQLILATDGHRETVDLSTNDVVAAFVDTFRHVLAGELTALRQAYRVTFTVQETRWTLRLVPRPEPLRRFLRELVLEGVGHGVERMTMVERSGDTTTTTFTDVDPRHRFTDRERARLFNVD